MFLDESRTSAIGVTVGLYLAGLLDEMGVSQRLGIDWLEIHSALVEAGVVDAAMVPVEVDGDFSIRYFDIGRSDFARPLFDDDVDRLRSPDTLGLRLASAALLDLDDRPTGGGPAGLVMHTARCGSTLLCNLLTSVPGWVALKEPEFLNSLLLRLAAERDSCARDRLGALVARLLVGLAHGVRHNGHGAPRNCVVKLTSWNAMLAHEFLPHLGPTPLVVVIRDPWSTVASFLSDPPHWYVPVTFADDQPLEAVRFFAEAWQGVVAAALRLPPGQTLFVTYDAIVDDPASVLRTLVRHLGAKSDATPVGGVPDVLRLYSKGAIDEAFEPDGRHRREAPSAEIHSEVSAIAACTWSQLLQRMDQTRTKLV